MSNMTPETLSERIAAEFLRDPFCRVDKADQLVKEVARLLEVERAAKASWECGCGWVNGVNLDHCAQCGRTPAELAALAQTKETP